MTYQFDDIVLVRFPFTDQFTSKQRPGVIVSRAAYNRVRRDVVLMAITSQVRASFDLPRPGADAASRCGLRFANPGSRVDAR